MTPCTSCVPDSLPSLGELIDNAIDSGATIIDIRLKDNGVQFIEVSDNGKGIKPSEFDYLCKQHCTSKLTSFDDFNILTSFGFRGEALNALASLSDLQITTRDHDSRLASKLTFDNRGKIIKHEQCPRTVNYEKIGTTVLVNQLFKFLPVRFQELNRKSRTEFLKLLDCVQSYAFSCTRIRFTCSNMIGNKRSLILSSPGGNATLKDVISSLFGTEKGTNVIEIIDAFPNADIRNMYGLNEGSNLDDIFRSIRLHGFVSTCEFNQGRSTADRQFVFVNQRPVDFSRLCRIANEVYNIFNRGRYCMIVLFVDIPPSTVDVNVSPDKKTVFLHYEKEVFAKLRASLFETFSNVQGNCPYALSKGKSENRKRPFKLLFDDVLVQKNFSNTQQSIDTDYLTLNNDIQEKSNEITKEAQENSNNLNKSFDMDATEVHEECDSIDQSLDLSENNQLIRSTSNTCELSRVSISRIGSGFSKAKDLIKKRKSNSSDNFGSSNRSSVMKTLEEFTFQRIKDSSITHPSAPKPTVSDSAKLNDNSQSSKSPKKIILDCESHQPDILIDDSNLEYQEEIFSSSTILRPQQTLYIDMEQLAKNFVRKYACREVVIDSSNDSVNRLRLLKSGDMDGDEQSLDKENAEKFKKVAEQHLSILLKNHDFERMQVIGQFNNAFIITRLDSHMFMIDQHAADEKYNFEKLQSTFKIDSQPLIKASFLQLGAVNEAILIDHIEIFRLNGFNFSVDEKADSGQKIRLTAVPCLKKWNLDRDDIDELIGFLSECPGVMQRPSKLRRFKCKLKLGTVLKRKISNMSESSKTTHNSSFIC